MSSRPTVEPPQPLMDVLWLPARCRRANRRGRQAETPAGDGFHAFEAASASDKSVGAELALFIKKRVWGRA